MPWAERFPVSVWIWRRITFPSARRSYMSTIRWSPVIIVLLLVAISVAAHIYSFILTRRIHAVLNGLEQLKIDQTTEEEMLRTVPYLERDFGGAYIVRIGSKYDERGWEEPVVPRIGFLMWGSDEYLSAADRLAHWLGYRYSFFDASFSFHDGKVSGIRYGIAVRGVPPSWLISVNSHHGFFAHRDGQIIVSSADDENLQYQIEGNENYLGVSYTFDAPRNLTSHAFQFDLSCVWSLIGCRDAKQVAPLVWRDKQAIETAAAARLNSNDPCPDRTLAGRIRYLLDTSVVLVEVNHVRPEKVTEWGQPFVEIIPDYRVLEVLHGDPQAKGGMRPIPSFPWISSPQYPYPNERIPNPELKWIAPGSRVLMFAGSGFSSCRVVPATPSALSTVRNTVPAPKRAEDDPGSGWL
jgi:hypothetical protein